MSKKISNSEVGHIKNVENFEDLLRICESYEPIYNPQLAAIQTASLATILTEGKKVIKLNHDTRVAYILVINDRQIKFQELRHLVTRVMNAFAVSGADELIIKDLRTVVRKIHGKPSVPKTDENREGQETERPRSNSQQSYDRKIDNFTYAIEIVEQSGIYEPNEDDLKIPALKAYLAELKIANAAVMPAYTPYSKAMKKRDVVLYHPKTGMLTHAADVKKYFKSLFGASSPEFKQVNSIEFKRRK